MSDSDSELVITETVAKPPKKPRTPAQAAATKKAFDAMKARREALAKGTNSPPKEQKQKSEPVAPKTEEPPAPASAPAPAPAHVGVPNDITEFAKQIILALRPTGVAEPINMAKARRPRKARVEPTAHEEAPSPRHSGIREPQAGSQRLVSIEEPPRLSMREELMRSFKKEQPTVKHLKGTDLLDKLFFSR